MEPSPKTLDLHLFRFNETSGFKEVEPYPMLQVCCVCKSWDMLCYDWIYSIFKITLNSVKAKFGG